MAASSQTVLFARLTLGDVAVPEVLGNQLPRALARVAEPAPGAGDEPYDITLRNRQAGEANAVRLRPFLKSTWARHILPVVILIADPLWAADPMATFGWP